MSITKRIAFGAAASWFSRGVTILMGVVLLPVLFRHLPKEELGVWLLLGQSWAALGIFDFGFGATLTRRIAFAKAKSGSDPGVVLTDETLREIADLVATGKLVYRALAIFAFIFSFVAGFFYLRTLHLGSMPDFPSLVCVGYYLFEPGPRRLGKCVECCPAWRRFCGLGRGPGFAGQCANVADPDYRSVVWRRIGRAGRGGGNGRIDPAIFDARFCETQKTGNVFNLWQVRFCFGERHDPAGSSGMGDGPGRIARALH